MMQQGDDKPWNNIAVVFMIFQHYYLLAATTLIYTWKHRFLQSEIPRLFPELGYQYWLITSKKRNFPYPKPLYFKVLSMISGKFVNQFYKVQNYFIKTTGMFFLVSSSSE